MQHKQDIAYKNILSSKKLDDRFELNSGEINKVKH